MRSRERLREAIWAWDPIGLNAHRDQIPDEYDALVQIAEQLFDAGASGAEAAERILSELASNWGIKADATGLSENLDLAYRQSGDSSQ